MTSLGEHVVALGGHSGLFRGIWSPAVFPRTTLAATADAPLPAQIPPTEGMVAPAGDLCTGGRLLLLAAPSLVPLGGAGKQGDLRGSILE